MPIYRGTQTPPTFRVGTKTPVRIFQGDKYVWPQFPSTTQTFTVPGEFIYNIPAGCLYIDEILLGGGGGSSGGGFGLSGAGGEGATWKWRTLKRGVDIPWSQTSIVGTIGDGGAGGAGGFSPKNGSPGSPTVGTQVAPGGNGGGSWGAGGQAGGAVQGGNASSGRDVLFNDYSYAGGGATATIGGSSPGNPPGGGARGGANTGGNGAKGAAGTAIYRAYT